MSILPDESQFCGKSENGIDFSSLEKPISAAIVDPLLELKKSANANGFSLVIASGFRSFDRQLKIWNAKADNKRPVLDANGIKLDVSQLSDKELVFAILRWSALPGASRHHWGTDVDVYDASKINDDYVLQLTIDECVNNGPFAKFHLWLDQEILNNNTEFFRPYAKDTGGVAPEPWHLSYKPLSQEFQKLQSIERVRKNIEEADIFLKNSILENFDEIFERFILCN